MTDTQFQTPKLSIPLVISLVFIACAAVGLNLLHQKPAELDLNKQGIQYSASYLISDTQAEAQKLYRQDSWIELEDSLSYSMGYSEQALWLRLKLHNLSLHSQAFILHLNNSLTDSIELFYFDQAGEFVHKRDYGDNLPFHSREIPIKSYAIPIELEAKQQGSYLIKFSGQSALGFNLQFLDVDSMAELVISEYLTLGFLFGALVLMAIFSYLLHLASKQRLYLYFSLFVLSTSLALSHLSGAGFSFVWPEQPVLNALVFPVSVSLIVFFGSYFFQAIINFNQPDKLNRFFFFAKCSAVTPTLSLFVTSLQTSYLLSLIFFSVGVLTSAAIAIKECCKGHNIAAYYLISLLVYLSGIVFYFLDALGMINSININILFYTGALYQTSILTATIIYYINFNLFENERRLNGQINQLYDEQTKLNKQLQTNQKVLSETYERLQQNYSEFNQLSQIDALTKLKNRLYFQDFIDHAYLHAKQHQYPISLVFCDIDRFQQLNSQHSPILGDKFLLSCAEIIQQRSEVFDNYCCARFSGQEFVVVLPHCSAKQALENAERIRQAIANITHVWQGKKVSITASLGIACHGPKQYISVSKLIEQADEAMINAKHNGRNQVQRF